MSYTVSTFWAQRLQGLLRPSRRLSLAGWDIEATPNASFVEAALQLRPGFQSLNSPIWFVAAPGAVGKSTLAKEISARTGAVYLDLAKADTVAGNYLTGGLVKSGLLPAWQQGSAAVLIDALDEARLRVTQTSFDDFLHDVRTIAASRSLPTVLFGRVGVVEDAWLSLSEQGLDCPIFDIELFDKERAVRFVLATLQRLSAKSSYPHLKGATSAHQGIYHNVAQQFVDRLTVAAASDGTRFAGYAPVLEAVATVIAGVTNPATLSQSVQAAMQGDVLQHLTTHILEREAAKIREQLSTLIAPTTLGGLYTPEEQLSRLAAVVLGGPVPRSPQALKPNELAAYDTAIQNFLPQHPFLDGTGKKASGAVFSASINANALFSATREVAALAEASAGNGPHTPNPFLVDFYLSRVNTASGDAPAVPPEHVVFLYESVQARAEPGDIVRMSIEGDEDGPDAEVEIQVGRLETGLKGRIELTTSQAGTLRFGRQVNAVAVDAPNLEVVIGSGQPVEIIAPVSISVDRLSLDCPELVIAAGDQSSDKEDASVLLEAQTLVSSSLTGVPVVRKGAELSVSWPGAGAYPWTHFAAAAGSGTDKALDEDLRGLRRLVLAFRSHSRGRLARYKKKIEHKRMTKGTRGVLIRQVLLEDGILKLEGSMYFLDADALGKIVGASYQDLKLRRLTPSVHSYLAKRLGE